MTEAGLIALCDRFSARLATDVETVRAGRREQTPTYGEGREEMAEQIAVTPARTRAGLQAKVRSMLAWQAIFVPPGSMEIDRQIAASLAEDLLA